MIKAKAKAVSPAKNRININTYKARMRTLAYERDELMKYIRHFDESTPQYRDAERRLSEINAQLYR